MTRSFLAALAALVVLAPLTACGSSSKEKRSLSDIPCPRVVVISNANHMTVFREGPGRDLTDVAYEAAIGRPEGSCRYLSRNSLRFDAKAEITAQIGPAAAEKARIEIPYFVALVTVGETVITKQTGTAGFKVSPDSRFASAAVKIDDIEVTLEPGQTGRNLEILIGLQLTQDQLDYNRGLR